ncbi:MAG: SDR family oxidoreductase [Bdellovibrionaceae bacterium]|nr:SDR family oxidoreductase [Pseudobdellovibrionaceae bacterium]MBX3034659.1 SDR family oxidoreductase [Pseudobdellovibrionaceae bacterium]
MSSNSSGRIVVITGATSGFGRGLVREFLDNGDTVIATGRQLTRRPEILQEERAGFGERLIEMDLDVTLSLEREIFVQTCQEKFGRVDVLVNNAGYGLFGALEDTGEMQLRAQMEVNYFGLVLLTRDLLPLLRSSRGRIFNFSSVLGFMGFPLTALYCASKHAIEGFTESLSFELRSHGVQVCLIEPGSYQTGFGGSVMWAEKSADENSAFFRQSKNYKDFREVLSNGPTLNKVSDVPRGVVRLSRRSRLPLRARFGKDSQATYWLRRLLPARLFLFMMTRFFATNINR